MQKKSVIIIIISIILLVFSTNIVCAANQMVDNDYPLVELKDKPDMTGSNIILGIIAIIEIAVTSLIISKYNNNAVRGNLILLVTFGILTVSAIFIGIAISCIIANAKEPMMYLGLHHISIYLCNINFIPFVLSIIALPFTVIKSKNQKAKVRG